ncbi:CPBP family intramembrane glutamic endopeptidase [Virgibacillus byunsanensis]|uniref:CPBP family intramembrane glutamic endopeptidase n=1 Tax=Virgibacillus byunsanensis TaxID=570945 RepID=A0ABW3LNG5_9BACI
MTKRYWYVILTYIIMQFSGIIFSPILLILFPITQFEAVVYWSIFSFIAGLVVVLYLMKPDMKKTPSRNDQRSGNLVLWSILGVFMAYFAQIFAGIIEMQVFNIEANSENTQLIMEIARAAPIFVVVPALVAPILEEIIFRKIIFGGLYTRTNFFIAALLSALIFALIHGEPEHLLRYGAIGFVFAFLYVKTKRILVPIIVHMALNTMAVIIQFSLSPEDIERMQRELEQLQMIFIGG